MATGLTSVLSNFGAAETMSLLKEAIGAAGMTLFAHVDHAAAATASQQTLRPTDVLIFGNPKGGTPLMQANQTIGIDLPLKTLVYQDAAGQVWLAYNDPRWIAERHGLDPKGFASVEGMVSALKKIVARATESQVKD